MSVQLTNTIKVSVVSAICLIGLVVALKNFLGVPAQVLSRDVVLFIITYSAFSIVYPEPSADTRASTLDKPLCWSLLIVLVTVAIFIVYAV